MPLDSSSKISKIKIKKHTNKRRKMLTNILRSLIYELFLETFYGKLTK